MEGYKMSYEAGVFIGMIMMGVLLMGVFLVAILRATLRQKRDLWDYVRHKKLSGDFDNWYDERKALREKLK